MEEQQFNQFMQAEQAGRLAARDAAAEQHAERQRMDREKTGKTAADSQAKRVPSCRGDTTKSVREWCREVTLTIPYSAATVYIAARTATGPLKWEVERFLEAAPDRNAVTWEELSAHVRAQFLSTHEDDHLRDEVSRTKQTAYETTAAYGRRFREAADLGYPVAGRNADQQRILKEAYLRGLRDRLLVERLIREGHPATFAAAITLTQAYEADEYLVTRALEGVDLGPRREEPMEVDLTERQSVAVERDESPQLAKLTRQVSGMSSQINKLIASQQQQGQWVENRKGGSQQPPQPRTQRPQGPIQQSRSRLKWDQATGKPICIRCGKVGHIGKDHDQGPGGPQGQRQPTQRNTRQNPNQEVGN